MKKVLFATTALAGMAALAAPAQAAEPLKLELGGFFDSYVAYVDQDESGANTDLEDVTIEADAEIHFKAKTTLDNGLKVGAKVELEVVGDNDIAPGNGGVADGAVHFDEYYVYLQGGFGRVEIGSQDGAYSNMQYGVPGGQLGVDDVEVFYNTAGDANFTGTVAAANYGGFNPDFDAHTSDDNSKIVYYTPRLSGFQGGIAYTPSQKEGSVEGANGVNNLATGGGAVFSDTYEISLAFETSMNNVDLGLQGGYITTQNESTTAATDEDQDAWIFTANVAYRGFTLGGLYESVDNRGGTDNADGNQWAVGLGYETGPWNFGIGYAATEVDQGAGAGAHEDEASVISAGVGYTFGPGMKAFFDIQHVENEDGATLTAAQIAAGNTSEFDATTYTVGIALGL